MGKINVLSFAVANLIAAGEVVDRPSSVIKELVENSIDSGADRITVEIMRGGISFMRVSDNGCGMSPDDLPVAVKRHATSKIHSAADLNGIRTLGFRGEALAAICAVSDVRIISKTRDSDLGAIYEIHGGANGELSERGASDGTTVIVENLFANVPARLKFLKKDATEAMSVAATVEKVALSHPEIAFTYISDGTVKLETSGNGDLRSAVRAVFGKAYCDGMIPVSDEREGIKISGFICAPMQVRANRNYENFFINGRYIKTKTGSAAIEQAYSSYIPPEKFPGCVMRIDISPEAVDVNVHPAKLEVKFSNERPVFDAVYYAVRRALTENDRRPELGFQAGQKMPSVSFAPQHASDAFVPVGSSADRGVQMNITSSAHVAAANKPAVERGAAAPFEQPAAVVKSEIPDKPYLNGIRAPMNAAEYGEYLKYRGGESVIGIDDEYTEFENYVSPGTGYIEPEIIRIMYGGEDAQKGSAAAASLNVSQTVPVPVPPAAPEADKDSRDVPAKTGIDYRIVGEIFNSYIIVEKGDTCLIIDKHAAHERQNFERFKRRMQSSERATVLLAVPCDVMLMNSEVAALEEYRAEIEKLGFEFTSSRNSVGLTAIPDGLDQSEAVGMIEAFAGVLTGSAGNVELTHDLIFEKALYQASCKASVKAGRVYPEEYITRLVDDLMKMPDITYCPHGRPVAFEMKKSALDHRFKRT
ncbi:MAG: DNA mismatch repair endonuclease MutL [Eubacteriales bacterium]